MINIYFMNFNVYSLNLNYPLLDAWLGYACRKSVIWDFDLSVPFRVNTLVILLPVIALLTAPHVAAQASKHEEHYDKYSYKKTDENRHNAHVVQVYVAIEENVVSGRVLSREVSHFNYYLLSHSAKALLESVERTVGDVVEDVDESDQGPGGGKGD